MSLPRAALRVVWMECDKGWRERQRASDRLWVGGLVACWRALYPPTSMKTSTWGRGDGSRMRLTMPA